MPNRRLNYAVLYQLYGGRILRAGNCGELVCGQANCCHSTGPGSYIFFAPGEREFHRGQGDPIPFVTVDPDHPERQHCAGLAGCVAGLRPLDCRSYPFFPAVIDGHHVGYYDCRDAHACPLVTIQLVAHLRQIHNWWQILLRRPAVRAWAESTRLAHSGRPIVPCPHVPARQPGVSA